MSSDIFNYAYSKATGMYHPHRYPVQQYEEEVLPATISSTFNKLRSSIEQRYENDWLKVCVTQNKIYATLKDYMSYQTASHNAPSWGIMEQETTTTGSGISTNVLKAIHSAVVSRLANLSFEVFLVPEVPSTVYEIAKDNITRYFRKFIRKERIATKCRDIINDAAILSFGHLFIDPWSHKIRKLADWEVGYFETEFAEYNIKHCVIRDFSFPVTELGPYVRGFDADRLADLIRGRFAVDLQLYIDSVRHEKWVLIGNTLVSTTPYEHDKVFLYTYSWDVGIKRMLVTSLFDQLWPMQRTINKLRAKQAQLILDYKGPIPVISNEASVSMQQITNGTGECLVMEGVRGADPASVITTINPTPLDPQLDATINALKQQMYETAGIQQGTLDIENYRSAAAIVALEQIRDQNWQSQLTNLSDFIKEFIYGYIEYMSFQFPEEELEEGITWGVLKELINNAYLNVIPAHVNVLTGDAPIEVIAPGDQIVNKFILAVVQGKKTFEDMDVLLDYDKVKVGLAKKWESLRAAGDTEEYEARILVFLAQCFIKDIKEGLYQL